MIVLGIDPAIRTTGYGVLSAGSVSQLKVLDCGVITNCCNLFSFIINIFFDLIK